MRGVICYDFSDDKARSKLVKILSKYGTRIQYSVFQFRLDKDTWKKLISKLVEQEFTTGIHNIIIIPITDSDHSKIINLGQVFIPFSYETAMYSAFGIQCYGPRNELKKKSKNKIPNSQTKEIIDTIFQDQAE